MRFGFAPEMDDDSATIVDLGTGMAVVDEDPEEQGGFDNLAYFALTVGPFTIEWRLHR